MNPENIESRRVSRRRGGFTLLEVTLALSLLVILMGGVYGIATGALQLGAEVSEAQNREMLVHSFLQLCRRNIEQLPGNGTLTLAAEEDGRYYVTEVSFLDTPLAFSFAAIPAGYDKTVLESVADPRGYLRVNLRYLNEEDENTVSATTSYDEDGGITLPLLDGVSIFEWRFYDLDEEEWVVIWEEDNGRPSFVELTLGFFDGGDPVRTVFWVPPIADPETIITGGGAGGAGGAGGPGGGGPGGGGPGGGGPGGGGPGGGGPGGGGPGGGGPGGGPGDGGPRDGGPRGGGPRGGGPGGGPDGGPDGGRPGPRSSGPSTR